MRKPKILFGKSNDLRYFVWRASETWAVISGDAIFLLLLVYLADFDIHQEHPTTIFGKYLFGRRFEI